MPKISVIMPVYNSEKYLSEAIESILSQTYPDFEFIIIDDCSQDKSYQIAASYHDPRIVLLQNEENKGVAATLNRGIDTAKGEFIARMDADDISFPERFQEQILHLNSHPHIGVLGTAVRFCGAKEGNHYNPSHAEQAKIDLLFNSCLCHPSVMIRRDCLINNRYDVAYEGCEDYELWWRLSQHCKIESLPTILFTYRIHPKQVTNNTSSQVRRMLLSLKKRQLNDIGIAVDEDCLIAFINFCTGGERSYKMCHSLFKLFKQITTTNFKISFFNQEKLKFTFSQIEKSLMVQSTWARFICLIPHCKHCSFASCFLSKVKHFAQK